MTCQEGKCENDIKTCCFRCGNYDKCPADIKCDDIEGFKAGNCGGSEEC